MKILVAFGCSHTHGSMIDGKDGSSEYNIRNGFPGMFAKRNGYQLINISKPGGSNQYIHRQVIEFITGHMNPAHEYLFLIGWTSSNRIELRYPDYEDHTYHTVGDYQDRKYVAFSQGTSPDVFHTDPIKKLLDFTPLFLDTSAMETKWAAYACSLQNILYSKGIPYLMHNTCTELRKNHMNNDIVHAIDTTYYPHHTNKKMCMVQYLLDKKVPKTECWHFQKEGHAMWADKLSLWANQAGLV